MKSIVLYFLLLLNSCFAEISEAYMRDRFQEFKSAHVPVVDCANSILFLEGLKFDFLNNPDPANKAFQIEMMEKILYGGVGVGGLVSRACSPKEYTIMTEAAVLLAMWHKKQNKIDDLHARTVGYKFAVEGQHKNIVKHYETLNVINATVDAIYDDDGTKLFFKDVVSAVVQTLQTSKPSMKEDEFLRIPAMRQFDVLVANIMGSIGFIGCTGNEPNDYIDLAVDDGLNALRADMRALMSPATPAAAIQHGDAIEAKLWGLSLADLETADVAKGTLIRRAFAAVERIKSVRFDGSYRLKDPRVVEDKLKDIPPAPADADAKKKNTRLLLISMALQEYYYNPLNTLEDIQKIILAKLQQSNYWETDGLLLDKTDLAPYPYELPDYATEVIGGALAQANTVPPVYTEFVQAIQQMASEHKGSIYSRGNDVHYVGGNTFLHLASSGHMNQCGFFSFGLMDDSREGGPNARQKFFEILSNSLELNTLRDIAKMSSVLEGIEKFAMGTEEDFKIFKVVEKVRSIHHAATPNRKAWTEGVYEVRDFFKGAKDLVGYIQTLARDEIKNNIDTEQQKYEKARADKAQELGLTEVNDAYGLLDNDLRSRYFEELMRIRDYKKSMICVEDLRLLLVSNQTAKKAFSVYARNVLAGKLLPEELPVSDVNYRNNSLQLLFRPGYEVAQEVKSLESRATAVSPTAIIAEALNVNVQVMAQSALFGHGVQRIGIDNPYRLFSPGVILLQNILSSQNAKNVVLWGFGGHYEKLISLSDPVSLVRGLRHLAWKGTEVLKIG